MNYHFHFQVIIGVTLSLYKLRPEVIGGDFLQLDMVILYQTNLVTVNFVMLYTQRIVAL